MGARHDFLNQALLDRRRSVYRVRVSPDVNKDGGRLLLRRTVWQCVNRETVFDSKNHSGLPLGRVVLILKFKEHFRYFNGLLLI